ncbi:MAG: hypothetical protein U0637_10350 [Phycisphaerales bacterium]
MALSLMAGQVFAQVEGPQPGPLAKAEKAVAREGEGPRRATLDGGERKPFDSLAWAKLSDWTNGKALTQTDTAGKVVLIVTWTDYLPTGRKAVQTAVRLADKYKNDLVVVMAHSAQDWENAAKPKAAAGTLLVAHDAKGEFRGAINADMDPDFYLLDRAGNMRYADVIAEAVDGAVDQLVKESSDDAANINKRLDDERAALLREFKRSQAINKDGTFVEIPELPFPAPSESAYNDVKWPPRPADEQKLQNDPKAELPAKQIPLPTAGWYPKKPELKGRVIFAYEWNPYVSSSFARIMAQMDDLQRKYGRDVVCVGIMINAESFNGRKFTNEQRDPKKMMERFDDICKSREFAHYLVPSMDSDPFRVLQPDSTETTLPAFMVISSDGWCRWWQHEQAKINGFAALDEILKTDPGVLARRQVEEEWLKTHAKAGK